jgi:RNA-directed DNA polymerase
MTPSTINNLVQLANFLRCSEEFLAAFLVGDIVINDRLHPRPSRATTDLTTVIDKLYLRKKDRRVRGYREIYSIQTDTLKDVLKGLNTVLQKLFTPSDAVHGYVPGRNIRTNAAQHLAKKHLLSVDIYHFFESITAPVVEWSLEKIGFTSFAASRLSQLVTVNGFLPPGYPTSPTLSNLVVQDMDEEFLRLCGTGASYTRYADDLYFSSDKPLPLLTDIEAVIDDHGFSLNKDKTKLMPRGSKQYVTGLTVFDHVRPRVAKAIKRKLRLEIHYMKCYGIKSHALHSLGYTSDDYDNDLMAQVATQALMNHNRMIITGWLQFLKSVERPSGLKLEAEWKLAKP